jgi:alkylated DNA repair protein (DNA oxidative demethylase)
MTAAFMTDGRMVSILGLMTLAAATGFRLFPAKLGQAEQQALVEEVLAKAAEAPLIRQVTPGGKSMSVETTSFGKLGWTTDRNGYRYEPVHPLTGRPWPAIPQVLLDLWAELADPTTPPDACLVNLYRAEARMGLHQDKDEADFSFPVLSVSLGDTAVFRLGGPKRSDPTTSLRLSSGDVCLLAGEARLFHHGIDRILAGSSRLIPGGGRINLTLRRAGQA